MAAAFGGGWDAVLTLEWTELLLRFIEATDLQEEALISVARMLGGRPS